MFLGIAADLAVAGQYLNKDQYDDAVSMAVAALSNNVTSKTYMQGISELIDFINDPNEKAIQYFGRDGGYPSSPSRRRPDSRASRPTIPCARCETLWITP